MTKSGEWSVVVHRTARPDEHDGGENLLEGLADIVRHAKGEPGRSFSVAVSGKTPAELLRRARAAVRLATSE